MFRIPIVLVDDDTEELDQLNRAFALSGLPCLPILYNPQNISGIDHVTSETKHVRIVALDINLREFQDPRDAKILYPPIEKVLEKLNPTGPYFLIFWSMYKDLPNEIIELLATRSNEAVQAPIGYGVLDKNDYRDTGSAGRLKDDLLALVEKVALFRLLIEWEERTSYAASYTLAGLNEIAARHNANGWKFKETTESLATLITHIANEAVGLKNALRAANHAVESGLLPILEDKLLRMTVEDESAGLDKKWTDCLTRLGKNIPESMGEEDISSLNTFYNLEEVPESYSKCKRGVFVKFPEEVFSDFEKYASTLGEHDEGLNGIVSDEFLFLGTNDEKTEVARASTLGWLEIGASCDHAQLKNRLHRYLLGMMIPARFKRFLRSDSRLLKDRNHEGIYRSPVFRYRTEDYILFFSFRFQIGVRPSSGLLGVPMFRLKEKILNEIAFNWSKHSIRPGITSFRNE